MAAVSRIVSISSMKSPWRNRPLACAGLRLSAPTTRNLPPDCLTCRPMPTLPMCSSALRPSTHCRTRSGDATAKSTASGKPFSPSIRTWNMQCFAPPIPEPFRTSGLVADLRGCKFSKRVFTFAGKENSAHMRSSSVSEGPAVADMYRTGLRPVHDMKPFPTAMSVLWTGCCHCLFSSLSRENL